MDSSEAYRFTMDMSSMIEEAFPYSPKTVRSFFLRNDGGEPKSGPNQKSEEINEAGNAFGMNS